MKNLILPAVALFLAIAGMVGFISCSSASTPDTQPDLGTLLPGQTSGIPLVTQITMQNLRFIPETVIVPAGTEITWINDDSVTHTVTSDTSLFDSSIIRPGGTFSFTFTDIGTYDYHCTIHSGMRGTIIVQ